MDARLKPTPQNMFHANLFLLLNILLCLSRLLQSRVHHADRKRLQLALRDGLHEMKDHRDVIEQLKSHYYSLQSTDQVPKIPKQSVFLYCQARTMIMNAPSPSLILGLNLLGTSPKEAFYQTNRTSSPPLHGCGTQRASQDALLDVKLRMIHFFCNKLVLFFVQSRPQSSSLLRMTDDGNSSGQSDFRSSADWLLKHNSITTGREDDTGVNKDG